MESRKRARRGTAPVGVVSQLGAGDGLALANIAALIDNGGQITLGALASDQMCGHRQR